MLEIDFTMLHFASLPRPQFLLKAPGMPQSGWLTFLQVSQGFGAIIQAIALILAGIYFIRQFLNGYFITNLTVGVSAQRFLGMSDDHLAICLVLKKGDRNTLKLSSIQYRVTPEGSAPIIGYISGNERSDVGHDATGNISGDYIDWNSHYPGHPHLNMTPGEETHLSAIRAVPRHAACLVEISVLGTRPGHADYAQWRASCVSFPVLKDPSERVE